MSLHFGPAAARKNLQHCEFEFLITHRCSLMTISVEQHVPMTAQGLFSRFGRVFQVELPKERKKKRGAAEGELGVPCPHLPRRGRRR